MPKFLLVPNPIGRYSIGDRTPVLQVAADGSVTIYLPAEGLTRPGQGVQLAARTRGRLPPGHAHVPAQSRDPQRRLPTASHHRDQLNVTRRVPRCTARPPARLSRPCVPAWADYCSASVFLIAAMPF